MLLRAGPNAYCGRATKITGRLSNAVNIPAPSEYECAKSCRKTTLDNSESDNLDPEFRTTSKRDQYSTFSGYILAET